MSSLLTLLRLIIALFGTFDLSMWALLYIDRSLMSTLFITSLAQPSHHGLQQLEARFMCIAFAMIGAVRLNGAWNVTQQVSGREEEQLLTYAMRTRR